MALGQRRQRSELSDNEISSIEQRHGAASFLSLKEVSVAAGLNTEQHVAFCLARSQLLMDFKEGVAGGPRRGLPQHIILHGQAGTGKSRVLSCLTTLCESWRQSESLMLMAPTGLAAANIGGQTVQSAVRFGPWSVRTGVGGNALPKRQEQELLTKWTPVRMVAIVEMSMVDTQLLHQIHARLQLVKGSTDDFGGINIVLSGDLTQLPPIVRQPLYMPFKKVRPGAVVEIDGHGLYLLFKKAVMLERNMRAAVDPDWTDVLSRMRLGVSMSADRAFLRGLSGFRERLQVG